jgi:hypothetical protein
MTATYENMTTADKPAARAKSMPGALIDGAGKDDSCVEQRQQLTDFPGSAGLRLNEEDLMVLSGQGFVCKEARGSLEFYKLRFRRGHQQVVRYIADAERAGAIRRELARLQADRKLRRELKVLTKSAKRTLREAKNKLEPILKIGGWKFHGLALRRSRKPQTQQ